MLIKRQAWAFSHKAEMWAVWMLRLKGYRVLARRYKSKLGKIDIIVVRSWRWPDHQIDA
jgi:putative endonuclease